MFQFAWGNLGRAARQHRCLLCDALFLMAVLAGAVLIAYGFDIFPDASGFPGRAQLIHIQEALALAVLFCGGLLALASRIFIAQQREVSRRIEVEQAMRQRALNSMINGFPHKPLFNLKVA